MLVHVEQALVQQVTDDPADGLAAAGCGDPAQPLVQVGVGDADFGHGGYSNLAIGLRSSSSLLPFGYLSSRTAVFLPKCFQPVG
jgi:hypothetical protein